MMNRMSRCLTGGQKLLLLLAVCALLLYSCGKKQLVQGSISYTIAYQLPDSLNSYKDYLPKTAIVYFKGDSTVSVQQAGDEATTVITYRPTNLVRVLLRSSTAKYVIDFSKTEQAEIMPAKLGYTYAATHETKVISGHKALKYTLTDKATGLTSEAWFTKEITIVPNYLTMVFDTTYGVPLSFTTSQNGMSATTTVNQVKFEPVPDGIFATPAGYQKMTAKQFSDLPVGN